MRCDDPEVGRPFFGLRFPMSRESGFRRLSNGGLGTLANLRSRRRRLDGPRALQNNRRMGCFRLTLLAAAGCSLGLPPVMAAAGDVVGDRPPIIYKWIDEDGIAHYTADLQRVPENVRSHVTTPGVPSRTAPSRDGPARSPDPSQRWVIEDAPPPDEDLSLPHTTGLDPQQRERAPSPALAAERAALDAEIADLEDRVARDEEALVELLANPDDSEDAELPEKPEFREIALRLPKLQAELRELRERRSQLEQP
jgi:hypothetical protein